MLRPTLRSRPLLQKNRRWSDPISAWFTSDPLLPPGRGFDAFGPGSATAVSG